MGSERDDPRPPMLSGKVLRATGRKGSWSDQFEWVDLSLIGGNVTKRAEETPPAAEVDPLAGLTPGRIVHYHPFPYEAMHSGAGPWAAIVTKVGHHSWPDTPGLVSLNVQVPMRAGVGEDPVRRLERIPFSDVEEPPPGSWSWIR